GPEHDAFEDLPARERHEEQPLRDRVARAVVGREVEALSAFGANEDVERLRLVEGEATVAIRERVPSPKHLPKWIPISGDDARRGLARACLHADALERRTAFPIDDDALEDASAFEREDGLLVRLLRQGHDVFERGRREAIGEDLDLVRPRRVALADLEPPLGR